MRVLAKILILIIGIVAIVVNYDRHFSTKAKKGKENLLNLKKIRQGMSENEVKQIMGFPDTIITRENYAIYCYDLYDESYEGQILIDSLDKVIQIYSPEK
jgi:hypothetical protein